MAQFPVSDQQGVIDGLNYVLSGPQSTGQNFQGVSFDATGYLTGNFRQPYVTANFTNLWVGPIALSTSEWLDSRTWKFTFASAQPTPPFVNGNNIEVAGSSVAFYNDYWGPIGVVECTTTYVVVRSVGSYANPGTGSGGTVSLSITTNDPTVWYSTDCNAKVTVKGATDRVFISAQINDIFQYSSNTADTLQYNVAINRYTAYPNNDATNPEFIFDDGVTISNQTYNLSVPATGTGAETFTITSGTAASNALQQTYYIPNAPTTTGTGSGVNLNITIAANTAAAYSTANTIVEIADGDYGEAYTVGDTITITGDLLGGATPANDLVLTVATVQANYVATNPNIETIFTTVIDDPEPGFYWYILELQWYALSDTMIINQSELGFRSLTAQLIKS